MTAGILASLGLYGGTLIVAFVAGMLPIVGIEVFLLGIATLYAPSWGQLIALVLLAALGHQIAKTSCYLAGAGAMALPRGKLKQQLDAAVGRIERWNKQPMLILGLSATVGLPPLYLLSFIARPLLGIGFWRFTIVVFIGRVLRFGVTTAAPLLLG
ncbi:MAG: hypothetical protein AB7P03_15000 [Kofleriaceae bacterium]